MRLLVTNEVARMHVADVSTIDHSVGNNSGCDEIFEPIGCMRILLM
jgi:hypothetical protein